jgi:hypothetical protein
MQQAARPNRENDLMNPHSGKRAWKAGTRFAAAALALVASVASAQAACVNATMYDLEGFKAGDRTALRALQYDRLFTLCVTSGSNGFMQILDTPETGDIEVIYPNAATNAGGNPEYAAVEAGKEYCFGDPATTFPLYHPRNEGSSGKLAITLTLTEDQQLEADAWSRPGEVRQHLGSHKQGGAACTGRDILYISYKAQ